MWKAKIDDHAELVQSSRERGREILMMSTRGGSFSSYLHAERFIMSTHGGVNHLLEEGRFATISKAEIGEGKSEAESGGAKNM